MYTDKFIEIPVEIIKRANEDLGLDEEYLCTDSLYIRKKDIRGYRKHFDDETGEYDEKTTIELKNGDTAIAVLSLKAFKNLLNKPKEKINLAN